MSTKEHQKHFENVLVFLQTKKYLTATKKIESIGRTNFINYYAEIINYYNWRQESWHGLIYKYWKYQFSYALAVL